MSGVTADDLTGAAGLGKPVLPLEELPARGYQLLLAVRPQDQAAVADRLIGNGRRVLRWDGMIAQ